MQEKKVIDDPPYKGFLPTPLALHYVS